MEGTEGRVNELEIEQQKLLSLSEREKTPEKRNEQSLRHFWDHNKRSNMESLESQKERRGWRKRIWLKKYSKK